MFFAWSTFLFCFLGPRLALSFHRHGSLNWFLISLVLSVLAPRQPGFFFGRAGFFISLGFFSGTFGHFFLSLFFFFSIFLFPAAFAG